MDKDKLKRLVVALGIGAVVGAFSWHLIALASPFTITSAITGGIIGTLITPILD